MADEPTEPNGSAPDPGLRGSDLIGLGGLLAGAVVAEATMEAIGLSSVEICPWALREGVILRRLDWMGQ